MDPTSPGRPGGAPAPGKGGGLGGWIKRNKGPAAAAGALVLVAVITIAKHGQSSSSASGSGTTGTTSQTGTQPGVYGYTGDSGYSSGYDQYAGEMASLQDLLNSYTAGTLGAQLFPNGLPQSTPTPAPKPTSSGGWKVSPTPPIITRGRTVGAQTITVPAGASLLSLSKKYLGTSNRTELAHANGLGTGAGLRAGQKLTIPAH